MALGFGAQFLFASRFFVQWIASERIGRSVVPVHFWYLSLGGGLLLLIYAIHRLDPVFILGQAGGLAIYARNLHLIHRKPRGDL
ncbi:MAG: lipid-A-disaccharide synthase N-terminal domain-containing protein [bacterium]|nr:lipid-A-disaccharide synthase N-terminal domain-containing protein [bacterium]